MEVIWPGHEESACLVILLAMWWWPSLNILLMIYNLLSLTNQHADPSQHHELASQHPVIFPPK